MSVGGEMAVTTIRYGGKPWPSPQGGCIIPDALADVLIEQMGAVDLRWPPEWTRRITFSWERCCCCGGKI